MRSWLLVEPGRLELREVPCPEPERDGLVVRVRTALTCGTDLKNFLRGHPKFPLPNVFGHEFSGEVSAVGADVRGWREGDAVMVAPTAPCGTCYWCEREQENLCPHVMPNMVLGAYADFIPIPGRVTRVNVYQKPADIGFAEAALLEPLSCVVYAQSQARFRKDDTVVVVGAGAFALLHVLLLRARGVERVFVATRGEGRAERARRAGALRVFTGGAENAIEAIREATNGRGVDAVIECTGQAAVWEKAIEMTRIGGTAVLFGGCPAGTRVSIDTARLHYDQLCIVSPFHFTPKATREAFELLAGSHLEVSVLFSGEYPLEQLPTALERLRGGDGCKFEVKP